MFGADEVLELIVLGRNAGLEKIRLPITNQRLRGVRSNEVDRHGSGKKSLKEVFAHRAFCALMCRPQGASADRRLAGTRGYFS